MHVIQARSLTKRYGEFTAVDGIDFAIEAGVMRPASGLPVGSDLEYADQVTLGRAFSGRRSMFPEAS